MSYIVWPLPEVTEELATQPRDVQDGFQAIMAAIAMNPFPNPQFPRLTQERARDGREVLFYSDRSFPYSIAMIRTEPDDLEFGVVLVIGLTRLRGR